VKLYGKPLTAKEERETEEALDMELTAEDMYSDMMEDLNSVLTNDQ